MSGQVDADDGTCGVQFGADALTWPQGPEVAERLMGHAVAASGIVDGVPAVGDRLPDRQVFARHVPMLTQR